MIVLTRISSPMQQPDNLGDCPGGCSGKEEEEADGGGGGGEGGRRQGRGQRHGNPRLWLQIYQEHQESLFVRTALHANYTSPTRTKAMRITIPHLQRYCLDGPGSLGLQESLDNSFLYSCSCASGADDALERGMPHMRRCACFHAVGVPEAIAARSQP